MSKIFGGSKSSGQSSNKAYDSVNSAFSPLMANAATGANSLNALLSGDTSGFQTFKNVGGFDAQAEQGSRGITGNAAASGMLRSGSTGKALTSFGNNIQNQWLNQYMDKLLQQSNMGFQAGNLLTSAGNTSTQTSNQNNGLSGLIGGLVSGGMISDIRLKRNIEYVETRPNGLRVYDFKYIPSIDKSGKTYRGYMAQEVEKLYPDAVVTNEEGFKSVYYDRIEEAT